MTITDKAVYQWDLSKGYEEEFLSFTDSPNCRFSMPTVLTLLQEDKTFRIRLEKLLSNYADCIDYHFFPLLKLIGDVEGFMGKVKDRMVKLTGEGADAQYLTWNQVPDTVKFEAETLTTWLMICPILHVFLFETLKGVGKASGTAFRFMFMGHTWR